MTVQRPELDDVRYADLVAQALAHLPVATPDWTDLNPSDPGVTVTEVLAYVCDGLAYAVSRYERGMEAKYAALLGEPPEAGRAPADALASAVRRLGRVDRAVSAGDVATVVRNGVLVLDLPLTRAHAGELEVEVVPLASPMWSLLATAEAGSDLVLVEGPALRAGEIVVLHGRGSVPAEATTVQTAGGTEQGTEVRLTAPLRARRAKGTPVGTADHDAAVSTRLDAAAAVGDRTVQVAPVPLPPRAVLSLGGKEWTVAGRLGRVGVVPRLDGPRPGVDVLVRPVAFGPPDDALCQAVYDLLRRRGVMATRFRVDGPQYLMVDVDVRVVRDPLGLQRTDTLRQAVADAVRAHLEPLTGGPDGTGWPFGAPIYRSALNRVVERVPGVDHVHRIAVAGDDTSDAWPLAKEPAAAARRLVNLREVRVTVLDAAEGW